MPPSRSLSPIKPSQITITSDFWKARRDSMQVTGLLHLYGQLVQSGRVQNFVDAAAGLKREWKGFVFDDSDVYKWLEACAYFNPSSFSKELKEATDFLIDFVTNAQEETGYLNTNFQLSRPEAKLKNLSMLHEMYCAGHLIESGVAWSEMTSGKDNRLLNISVKIADFYLNEFGESGRPGIPGHEEIELALIRLADCTGQEKYRNFARLLIERRGHRPSYFEQEMSDPESVALSPYGRKILFNHATESAPETYSGEYLQDHLPIREHTSVVGHAVRAMYLYIAATDLLKDSKDELLEIALSRAWENLTQKRMYITGGIGPSGENEGFTTDYDLPNLTAYAETCAACGLAWFGNRLLQVFKSSEFVDVIELALFNGALAGVSLDSTGYFYDNPLESRGTHKRVPWFPCACCPPNIARLIGSVGQFFGSYDSNSFWLHIPCGFKTNLEISGVNVSIEVESPYPKAGAFKVHIKPAKPVEFDFFLRIPDWAQETETDLPGLYEESTYENGYIKFHKTWMADDILTVDFFMEPRWVESHPKVLENASRVALMNGPIVYCAEETDLGFPPQLFSAFIEEEDEITVKKEDLGLLPTLSLQGAVSGEGFVDELYPPSGTSSSRNVEATFVPYFTWGNRGPNCMQVWIRKA